MCVIEVIIKRRCLGFVTFSKLYDIHVYSFTRLHTLCRDCLNEVSTVKLGPRSRISDSDPYLRKLHTAASGSVICVIISKRASVDKAFITRFNLE